MAALLAGTAVLTAAASALLGALAGSELSRAVSLGFYLVGSFLLVIAFFVGNRGPARVVDESDRPVAWFLPVFGSRRMRWATAEEHAETINVSALFMVLGLFLVALGALVDTRHQLV